MSEAMIDELGDWRADEELAEAMIPILGRLYREHDVIVYIFGRKLIRSSIDIIKAHRYARQYIGDEIAVSDSYPLLESLGKLSLDSAKVDLGKLTVAWLAAQADGAATQVKRIDHTVGCVDIRRYANQGAIRCIHANGLQSQVALIRDEHRRSVGDAVKGVEVADGGDRY